MNPDDGLPVAEITPVKLVPGQERISGYIDGLNAVLKLYAVKPSTFLEGATFLCNPYLRHNPDWIAQAAHSFREIGYLFSGAPEKRNRTRILIFLLPVLRKISIFTGTPHSRAKRIEEIIRSYLEEAEAAFLASRIAEMTHIFADISHHHSGRRGNPDEILKRLRRLSLALATDTAIDERIFLDLAKAFLNTISDTISAQLTIHKKIDLFCESLKNGKGDKRYLAFLIASNADARKYFYAKVAPESFEWLRKEGFFDVIKQKAEDPTKYSYRTPELDYFSRVLETNAKEVVDFILTVPVSAETFNPEIIDRFLWISSKLPADQLKRIVPKIRDDAWVKLMGPFNRWGFEYKEMFDALSKAGEHSGIVTLADAVLTVRSEEDVKRTSFGSVDNPFYFNDLHHSEVFERLCAVDDSQSEAVLKLVSQRLSAVVLLSGQKEDEVFSIGDLFSLFDVDFFTLNVAHERHLSARDDVRDLAATMKVFVDKLIGNKCTQSTEVRRIYDAYIVSLPDARTMWRLRMYIWSLCPDIFHEELKAAFFRGIESEKTLWPITGGAEYEQVLKKHFGILSEPEREKYIQRAFELFESEDKKHPYGFGILSSIHRFLSEDDKKRAETLYKQPLNPDFAPEPSIGHSYAGTVVPQTPPDSETEWTKTVPEIVALLKNEWAPEVLQKKYERHDFLKPINAEGVAGALLTNIKNRLPEYVANAQLFFDRESLDSHYTYTFLRGIQEAVRADYQAASEIDWRPLIELGVLIKESGTKTAYDNTRERENFDAWLAGWTGVLSNLADVIKELLRTHNGKPIMDFVTHRNVLLGILEFLLIYPDPQPKDEANKTAVISTKDPGDEEYQASDPLTIAINTTRGRAFETFVFFIEQDGKKFAKDAASKISEDVKKVYEQVLDKENTRAIRFMFGHYIAFFYYRDHDWMERSIFPILFTTEEAKFDLYLASWEGYLASSLYDELFKKLHKEYARAITLDPTTYTKRRYRTNLDDGIATHLALAYVHFKDFTFDSDLYKSFWNSPSTKRWGEFISFIGRSVISRDQPKNWLKEHPEVETKKLEAFWDWALEHCSDKKALEEFGFWMQTKDDIFDPVWLAERIDRTLEKTGGDIGWEIGFVDSLSTLAKAAPERTLSALRRHLIDGSILKEARGYIRVDGNLMEVLEILYAHPSTKDGTYKLINELLPIGGGQFWGLKDILK